MVVVLLPSFSSSSFCPRLRLPSEYEMSTKLTQDGTGRAEGREGEGERRRDPLLSFPPPHCASHSRCMEEEGGKREGFLGTKREAPTTFGGRTDGQKNGRGERGDPNNGVAASPHPRGEKEEEEEGET